MVPLALELLQKSGEDSSTHFSQPKPRNEAPGWEWLRPTALFKTMNDDEITKVANAMAQLGEIPSEAVTAVSDEFVSIYENEDSLIVSGDRFLKKVLFFLKIFFYL